MQDPYKQRRSFADLLATRSMIMGGVFLLGSFVYYLVKYRKLPEDTKDIPQPLLEQLKYDSAVTLIIFSIGMLVLLIGLVSAVVAYFKGKGTKQDEEE